MYHLSTRIARAYRSYFLPSYFLIILLLSLGLAHSSKLRAETQLVDINNASTAVLAERLPGIGPAKAKAIVAYRELHGLFASVEGLTEVKGIGPATLAKIRPLIFVNTSEKPNTGVKQEQSQRQQDNAVRNAVRAAVNIAKRYEAE